MTRIAPPPMATRCLIVALALLALIAPDRAAAQSSSPFQAVTYVNGAPITGYDVQQRAKLMRFGAGREVPDASRAALDELVADQLKIQEAERRGEKLSDADIAAAMENVAKNNGITLDKFVAALAAAGVDRATFEQKLRADVLWRSAVTKRYGDRIRPNDGEIDAALDAANQSGGAKFYDLKQVAVPLAASAPQATVRAAFQQVTALRRELTGCDKLGPIAQRLGPPSGDFGKRTEQQIPGPLREAVLRLKVGQTTDPLRSNNGVHVFILCGVGETQTADREQIRQQLTQEKAVRLSDNYLEELRRSATIGQ